MTARAHRRQQTGFTLVEVLVALALMAVMATMAWRGIDGMLRTREISQQRLQHTERLQSALLQWETDLRQLQDSGVLNPLAFDGASLLLTRRQRDGMQVVAWSLREGRLQRWASPLATTRAALTEAYAGAAQALAQNRQQLVVLEGVSAWQVYFYRNNSWSNAQSDGDVAAPASGVRMQIEFAPDSGLAGRLMREVALELPQP